MYDDVLVVGAGTMGHGIAQVCAMSGRRVRLVDTTEAALERAVSKIKANLDKGVARNKVSADVRDRALSLVSTTTDLETACQGIDLAIEAVVENMAVKTTVFSVLDEHTPGECVLASNTSSMSITELGALTSRPEQLIGLHFFNPVHIMKLLEIVVGERTSQETVAAASELASSLGKEPVVIRDSPGFATSRLGIAIAMEAIRMVETGVGSAQDIDKAMELGYRFPVGPLRLTDIVGLDVRLNITEYLYQELGSDTFRPPQLLKRMVRAGKLGKKSGEGFYRWED